MIKGVVKGRSLTIIGTDGDVFTSGSVGLKIKFTFDDEWDGLAKQAVFQNGSNAYISMAINDEVEVPWEVLSIPGRVLRIGIRGTNGTTLVIPTIYSECRIYEGSDKNGAAGQEWSPSEVDQVLSAVAAIDDKVGDLDDLLTTAKSSVVGAINEVFARPIPTGISDDLKEALLQLAQKVAYIDEDGQDYYDDLYYALYPGNLISITATYDTTHKALVGDTLDSLKPYLTVIAFYDDNTSREVTDYTLSGSLSNAGNNTISVYFIDHLIAVTASFIVSTISVSSISAVFTQGSAVIYDTDSLESLRQYLVVTANYSDSTSEVVTGYTLSGTLTAGTSTITVSYGGKTDVFTVTVTSTTLFSVENQIITVDDAMDTGVDILSADIDFSICLDIDFTAVNGDYKIAYQYENASPWRGLSFGKGANNSFNIKAISKFNVLNSNASSITRIKAVYTHIKNSGKYILYYRWNNASTTAVSTITESFVALTKDSDIRIGRHNATNNWAGAINRAAIRTFALTAAQAEAFITGE